MSLGITSRTALYSYQSLLGDNEIRLLALLPGRFDDPIRCTLTTVSLDDEPAFEALSYTWGSLTKEHSLVCDGKVLHATRNCYEGLRRLRRLKSIRVIWVDAVCISQDDVDERNQQILYMTRIYKQAKQVIVWLGDESDHDDLVPLADTKETWTFETNSKHARHLPQSWLQHFNRPWFLRVWIIQEVAFSQKTTVIHGRKKIPWRDFARIADDFEERAGMTRDRQTISNNPTLVDTIMMVYAIDDWQVISKNDDFEGLHPHSLLLATGGCRATDVRDKIYALRGLLPTYWQQQITPDYSITVERLLIDVAKSFLLINHPDALHKPSERWSDEQPLQILNYCKPLARRNGLPSWVPDFIGPMDRWGASSQETSLWTRWTWWSEGESNRDFEVDSIHPVKLTESDRVLRVQGLRISRVKTVSERYIDTPIARITPYQNVVECLHSWLDILRECPTFKDDHLLRLPRFLDAVTEVLATPLDARKVDEHRSHTWSGINHNARYYLLGRTEGLSSADSSIERTRKQRYIKTAKVINSVTKFSADPLNIVRGKFTRLFQQDEAILKKDRYPKVPATSDADSGSISGNISSHKTSSVSTVTPSSISIDTIDSDSDDPVTLRAVKKTINFTRKKVKRPIKEWSSFARKGYRKARGKASESASSSSIASSDRQSSTDELSGSGSDADSEGDSDSAGEAERPTSFEYISVRNGRPDNSRYGQSDSDEGIARHRSLSPQAGPRSTTPAHLQNAFGDIQFAREEYHSGPSRPSSLVHTDPQKSLRTDSKPPSSNSSNSASEAGNSTDDETNKRYLHCAKPGEPPVSAPYVRQRKTSSPCRCKMPKDVPYDGDTLPIDEDALEYHLSLAEEKMLFDPKQKHVHTNKAKRYLLEDLEIDKKMNKKRFGLIEYAGEGLICMLPIEARVSDFVCLIRGVRHPCVIREVDVGRYEWVGGCHVSTLWDWDFLELSIDKGGAGVGNLEEISLV